MLGEFYILVEQHFFVVHIFHLSQKYLNHPKQAKDHNYLAWVLKIGKGDEWGIINTRGKEHLLNYLFPFILSRYAKVMNGGITHTRGKEKALLFFKLFFFLSY